MNKTPFIQWKGWAIVTTHDNLLLSDEETPYLFESRELARGFIRNCIGLTGYKAVPVTLGNNYAAGAQQKG